MFRFIHAADIHLDSPLRGLANYETAPAEVIRNACRRAFENLVDLAIDKEVSFVLLAGDLYDRDWKDFNTGIFMSRQVGRLDKAGIRVLAVTGNHDAANQITKALTLPNNMVFFPTSKPRTEELDGLQVAVHGQGFRTRHVNENLASGYPNALEGMFNIGLLHTSLDGREGHADYAPCTAQDLRSKGYQYWALGHVHKFEVVERDPWIVFPGCVQGRNIRETGPKGCVLVTVEDGAVASAEPRYLDVMRWELCTVDITDVADNAELLDRTREAMINVQSAAEGRPIAMRVRLEGETTANEIAARPVQVEQQIRALAAELGDEDLWVEKVQFAASRKLDLAKVLEEDGPLASLLREILTEVEDAGDIDGLGEIVADIRQKLPLEAVSTEMGLELDSPECIARLVGEAKEMLVGRLLTGGDVG